MGIRVDLYKYDWDKLLNDLEAKGCNDRKMLVKILECFGEHIVNYGGVYIILKNELYEENNSYYNVCTVLDYYFKVEKTFDVFLYTREECVHNMSIYDAVEELGIEYDEVE